MRNKKIFLLFVLVVLIFAIGTIIFLAREINKKPVLEELEPKKINKEEVQKSENEEIKSSKLLLESKYLVNFGFVKGDDKDYLFAVYFKDKKSYIQLNDEVFGPYDELIGPIFSENGSKYGWQYKKDNEYYVRVNDETFGPYKEAGGFSIAKDGSKYSWWYVKNREFYVRVNDKIYGPYLYAFEMGMWDSGIPTFYFTTSPDGSKFAFAYAKAEKENWKYYVRVEDKIYGPYYYFSFINFNISFSNDGSRYGWRFQKYGVDDYYYVQINDRTYGPYDFASSPVFSPNGLNYGQAYLKNNKRYIRVNDKIFGPYDFDVEYLVLSNVNKKFGVVYRIQKDNSYVYYAMLDNKIYGPYDIIYNFILSNNGSRFALIYELNGDYYLKIDDQTYKLYGPPPENVSIFSLSDDGLNDKWFYKKDNKSYVMINNKTFEIDGDLIKFYSSDDGLSSTFIYKRDNNEYLWLNGRIYGPYDRADFIFTKNKEVYIIYVEKETIGVKKIL